MSERAQGQTSFHRNDVRGSGRYYRLTKQMNPKTIDWKMFLGSTFEVVKGVPLSPEMPFDRAAFGQWRCYWPFGGGLFTDLLVQQTTHLIAAMGVRFPARVVGSGGIRLARDDEDLTFARDQHVTLGPHRFFETHLLARQDTPGGGAVVAEQIDARRGFSIA